MTMSFMSVRASCKGLPLLVRPTSGVSHLRPVAAHAARKQRPDAGPSSFHNSSEKIEVKREQPSYSTWALSSALGAAVLGSMVSAEPAMSSTLSAVLASATDPQLTEGIIQGFLLIFFSELGDKTFFIALLLALQRQKSGVFIGTFGALALMTVISVALGRALHEVDELLPPALNAIPLDDVLAVVLLVYFGVATIKDAKDAQEKAAEEKSEAEEVVTGLTTNSAGLILSTFTLVFAAEWGDKSFLATIALAAASSPVGVTLGAVSGHGCATALAVLGGGFLSKNVNETLIQYAGGSLFLIFAAVSSFEIIQKMSGA